MFKKIVVSIMNFIFCHVLYRVKYYGLEKVNNIDKCLVCPNHSNTFEPVWVYVKIPHMWIMAKAELFKNKFLKKFFEAFNIFPIRRGEKDAKSLIHALNILKDNEKAKLLMFPEGTRIKKDRERGEAKVGAVYIAAKAKVPIIPAYITKNAKYFSSPKVIYGDPIDVPEEVLKDKEKLQSFSNELLDKIYSLKDKED